MKRFQTLLGAVASAALLLTPLAAQARANIVVNNLNAPGEGFNDPTPAAPVGGNPGTTVGEQRLIAFEFAASMWGATVTSSQTITIDAQFSPLQCDATSAVLGAAGPASQEMADSSFPITTVWYPAALANAFAGSDFTPGMGEISANFNSNIGTSNCLPGEGWYYGLDGKPGQGETDLPTVLLHEFSHGLGFLTYTGQNGSELQGHPDIFETFTFDNLIGKFWDKMSDAERAQSTLNPDKVVWTGSNVDGRTPSVLKYPLALHVVSPALDIDWSGADFGPAPTAGFTGDVAIVQDKAGGTATDACNPVTGVSGKIAIVDRIKPPTGQTTCTFKVKALNVQNAGAIGMIVADFPGETELIGMADDTAVKATITIPSVFVLNPDGNTLKTDVNNGTPTVVFQQGTTHFAGADDANEPYLFTPSTYQPGSSVSHWSLSAMPSLLMEPYIHPDIPLGLDLTPPFMKDIGWTLGADVTLAATKAGPPGAWPGGTAQYLLTVLNHGTVAANNVVLSAQPPTGLTLQSVEGSGCTTLPCTIGTVAADSRATVLVTYKIPVDYTTPDPVVEKASFTSDQGSTADNSVTLSSAVQQSADVGISTQAPTSVKGGDQQTLTVTLVNNGPSVAAGVDVTTSSATQVDLSGFSGDCSGNTCHFDSLQPGESKTVNVLFKASGDQTAGFQISVTSTTQDPNPDNNNVGVKFTVTSSGCNATGVGMDFLPLLLLAGALLFMRRRAQS